MSDKPKLDELADDDDLLEGCDLDFTEDALDELGVLRMVLLGDTLPSTPEAAEKLAFYQALAEAAKKDEG